MWAFFQPPGMHVLVQWATLTPASWVQVDAKPWGPGSWRSLPAKPKPTALSVVDDSPGWVSAVNVQGVVFEGFDCYAVLPEGQGLTVVGWNTDVGILPTESPHRSAEVWTFHPTRADDRFGGATNTHQVRTVYTEASTAQFQGLETTGGPVVARPWSEFVPPPAADTRYGVYVSPVLFDLLKAARSLVDWREWVA